jgi:hypothetical protein
MVQVLGGTQMDAFYSVDQTSDGSFIAAGITKDDNGTTPPL